MTTSLPPPPPSPLPLPLQFTSFPSSPSPSFWSTLTSLKLNTLGLSDAPIAITGTYSRGRVVVDEKSGERVELEGALRLGAESFEGGSEASTSSEVVVLKGVLRNFNTVEDFKNADKAALLEALADQIWSKCQDGSAQSPADLNPFLMLTFADLKKYRYYYWCGFPTLLQKPGWETIGPWTTMAESLTAAEIEAIQQHQSSSTETFALAKATSSGFEFSPLSSIESFLATTTSSERSLIVLDPSSHSSAPGWPLRNVLTYLSVAHSLSSIQVIAYRDTPNTVDQSRVASLRLKEGPSGGGDGGRPGVVGWEKNDKGKLGPRMADLAPLMDPARLADQAVDLNLQLMRWRIMPELNLDRIKNTKVLLLGAGTLGCYVARTLMAWGVRKITLVDSSTVSFSNPVRQPLFEFEDSLAGGRPKAEAAAAALKRIYPGVDATGVSLSIPMPGHPIAPALVEKTKEDVKVLEQLIEEHDVVYLLMDSRESRWLPTVIGASKRKLVMNAALGFDTFLVMRHGVPILPGDVASPTTVVPGEPYTGRLGCYYCNDIVAPMDSLKDRTLDQMCTVTRPGIASIASSTAVELMVSVLQHPKGIYAPSDIPLASSANQTQTVVQPDPATSSCLGIVPHQIRGYLAQFNNLKITGQAYDRCTGCSDTVTKAYESEGYAMLSQAFEDAKYLERLTGLDKMMEESEKAMEGMLEGWDEEDEEE